jgi:hypothetical protein
MEVLSLGATLVGALVGLGALVGPSILSPQSANVQRV